MLSIRDLLDAGTVDLDLASYLVACILKGSSFLVGARPGGAGKTTVMAALLNFIPDYEIVPTVDGATIKEGLGDSNPKCFVAHEIGAGRWYAYIWGREVQDFLKLTSNHMIAGNLHADDIGDVLATPGITAENITKLDLLVFLRIRRTHFGIKRRIGLVYENQGGNGVESFKPIFVWKEEGDLFEKLGESKLVTPLEIRRARDLLRSIVDRNLTRIEEVRQFILTALDESSGKKAASSHS